MSKVYRFKEYKEKIYEGKFTESTNDEIVNEGRLLDFSKKLRDLAKGALTKVKRFFVGKGSWLANLYVLQQNGKLPKGLTVYPYGSLGNYEEKTLDEVGFDKDSQSIYMHVPVSENVNEGVEDDNYVQLKSYMDMPNVDGEGFMQVVEDTYLNKSNLMVWGAPGIGKTAIINQVAKKNKANVIVVILSLMEPVDAIGLPEIDTVTVGNTKERRTVTRLPIWYPMDNYGIDGSETGGILFLDELNRANKAVMNALLTLVQDKKIDIAGYELPSEWVVLAAANREEDDPGNLEEIGTALGNRFQHVNFAPKAEDWNKWGRGVDKDGEQNITNDILGFIEFNKSYLHRLDPEGGPIWPSQRSWHNTSKELVKIKKRRQESGTPFGLHDIENIVARNVSPAVAKEFIAYLKVATEFPLHEIEKVYTNPKQAPKPKAGTNTGRIDTSLALLSSIAYIKNNVEVTDEEFFNLVEYAGLLDRPELTMPFMKVFFKLHPEFKTAKYYEDERLANLLSKFDEDDI